MRLAALALLGGAARASNLNGDYRVASVDGLVDFNTDYASKGHEFFDVWSPEIATRYSEAFWTDMGDVPLPPEIVARFAGKVIAITGYEQDQVMVTPTGRPGANPDADVSVPINWAYNHHYMLWMTGNYSAMRDVARPDPRDVRCHGAPCARAAVALPSAAARADPSIPVEQLFSEGNGGESRKSFHGYPAGYAQLIESPDTWHLTPMQVDTRNRACGVDKADVLGVDACGGAFVPGPEPRQARYGLGAPAGTPYSGLLECPCNGRFAGDPRFYPDSGTKHVETGEFALARGACGADDAIASAGECFERAAALFAYPGAGAVARNESVAEDTARPAGCSVRGAPGGGGGRDALVVTFNAATNATRTAACATGGKQRGAVGFAWPATSVEVALDAAAGRATITLAGPDGAWLGVGFGAKLMSDAPYTIIANASGAFEQQIGTCGSEAEHCAGDRLRPDSLEVLSNSAVDGARTVVVARPLANASARHYDFRPHLSGAATIDVIGARGQSDAFAYHAAHDVAKLTLLADGAGGASTCVCNGGDVGKMCEPNATNCEDFVKDCWPAPAASLLEQANPTCDSTHYAGGLRCCRHLQPLLDADQEVPDALLRYHMKFRFWFEEYAPARRLPSANASHANLERIYYTTEQAAGEYDVPPAFRAPGVPIPGYPDYPLDTPTPGTTCAGDCPRGPDCACEHTIHFYWSDPHPMRLLYAGGHCHAPSCLSIELYRNDTGHEMELLCRQLPYYGAGDTARDKFDERGYVALPPCLWGDDDGLRPSFVLPPDTPLVSIKRNNNTHAGHYGEMASWQMRGTYF